MIRKAKSLYSLLAVLMLLIGGFLILQPDMSLKIVCNILGGLLVVIGIVKLIGYFSNDLYHLAFQFDLAFGIFTAVIGIVLLVQPKHILAIVPTILGIFILADGVMRVQTAKDAKLFGMKKWWLILAMGLATVICGMLLILKPFESTIAMTMLLGATLLVDGAQNLFVVLHTVKTDRHMIIDGKYEEVR